MHPLRHLTLSNCWFNTYNFGQGKQLSCPHIFETHHGYTGNCPIFSSLEEAQQACDQVQSCDAINYKRTGDTCFKNCSGAFIYINGGPNWMSSVRSCPPSPPTFPPSPPPASGAKQDPHLTLAYGGRADFRGRNDTSYAMVSAPNVSVAMVIHDAIFGLHGNRIYGSFMTIMHGVFRTTKGRLLYLTYDSRRLNEAMWDWKMVKGSCAKTHHRVTFSMSPHTERACDEIALSIDVSTLSIKTPNWLFSVTAMPVFASYDGPTRRLDFMVGFNGEELKIRPHGLIGQSYDGTMIPRFGKTDKYPNRYANTTFVTQAMAEGAIDGAPNDYILKDAESTAFTFSRFDSF